jgi:hypothetical protein
MNPNSSTGQNTGTISTQNVGAPNGNAVTALSTVSCPLGGAFDTAAIQVVGTYTGVLTVQVQLDGGTWVDLTGATSLVNVATGVSAANIASAAQGVFQVDISGFTGVRVTAKAAVTGSAVVTIIATVGNGMTGIDTPITIAGTVATTSTSTPATPSAISVTSAASTNASSQKATAGSLFEITADNMTASAKFVKLYNKATAPTVGTDIPILTLEIAANASRTVEFGALGKRFTTGIAMAITGAQPVADTTATAAGDVHVHGSYI